MCNTKDNQGNSSNIAACGGQRSVGSVFSEHSQGNGNIEGSVEVHAHSNGLDTMVKDPPVHDDAEYVVESTPEACVNLVPMVLDPGAGQSVDTPLSASDSIGSRSDQGIGTSSYDSRSNAV
ncbi:hypothetical protein V6N11_059258 [Hibiscus sabdariffa]|uniref:Uncharacterized protein n=1 Tax=Hibiscus sabdariffa TaxID=183260 RepID=A0ABR2U6Y5_9ROSI